MKEDLRVALQKENVVRVNIPDRWHNAVVESQQTCPFRVSRLVHRVVASDPRVTLVSASNMFPEVNGSVLEVLVVPESSVSSRVIGVPILVLAAR